MLLIGLERYYALIQDTDDNRGLNYDKFFKDGDKTRNTLTEFNANNTCRLNLLETIDTIASLTYIQEQLEKKEK